MKTIYITEGQKNAIDKFLLLELSNRAVQREIEGAIRQYCAVSCGGYPIKRYLETPLTECPDYIRQMCDPSGNGQMWRSVANNQTGANKFIDFLRLNFLSQFNISHNSGPKFFATGLARISMGEIGFYSFNEHIMRGGDITTLGNIAMIIANKPELVEDLGLDENLNGMSFEDFRRIVVPKIKAFKKQENDELDFMDISANNGHRYEIIALNDTQYNYAQRTPDMPSKRLLQSLSQYTDWCICGAMGDMEYAQYVSNGSKFYICLRDDYKNIQREQGENCPLDDYGLSMIAVKVAPDGLPDNITTRWNHDNGGENHQGLWLATQLQKILGVRFKDIFKPRSSEELRQMNVGGAGELDENTPAAQDQVHGKSRCLTPGLVDGGLGGVMEGAEPESDEYGIGFENNSAMEYGHVNENTEAKGYDFKRDMKSIAAFMRSEGLNVYPYPKVKLSWEDQDGLFIRTGFYEPESKTIVVFCNGRHPKDILRTYAHEMIHHSQNLDGKDLNFETSEVKDDDRLEKIESEAYVKGNIYFRKWTEHMRAKGALNENIDYETVTAQAPDDKFPETLDYGINVNIDEHDWLDLIFSGEKTIATCGGRSFKEWKKHTGEMVGLVKTTRHPSKDNPSGVLVGYARLAAVKQYSDYNFVDDYVNHRIPPDCEDAEDRCGLVLTDVHELSNDFKVSHETETVRPLNYPNSKMDENTELELTGYHGTKANFDRFELSHGNEGAGSQVYGIGVYVTTVHDIAKDYADVAFGKVAGKNITDDATKISDTVWDVLNDVERVYETLARELAEILQLDPANDDIWSVAQNFAPVVVYNFLQFFRDEQATWHQEKWASVVANVLRKLSMETRPASVKVRCEDMLADAVDAIRVHRDYREGWIETRRKLNDLIEKYNPLYSKYEKMLSSLIDNEKILKYGKYIYTVDIPDEGYLEWKEEVPDQYKQVVHDAFFEVAKQDFRGWRKREGSDIEIESHLNVIMEQQQNWLYELTYGQMYEDLRTWCEDNENNNLGFVSQYLHNAGIVGIKVPTGHRTRKYVGEGNNYIIFNPEDVKILSIKNILNQQETMNESADSNRISTLQEKMWRRLAVENYGLTDNFRDAGFILTDGTLLDITDAENHRDAHSSIDVIGANKDEFMEMGEIRVQPEAPGLEIHKEPTKEQYETIERFLNEFRSADSLYFDCAKNGGKPMGAHYRKEDFGRILDDIRTYYSTTQIPQDDFSRFLEEGIDESTNPDTVDLSSFNIKKELNPKFWKDERLDSRIRMKLLDIADDFVEYLGVDWVKPDDIIMTGSLANFNWNKKYSDIDLHVLMDFSKVDKRRDFVKQYFDSKKNLWNDEHKDLKIFGFPIEVYVQDTNEKHSSTGVYSLDKDKWLTEPERDKLSTAKVNKQYIKSKVAEYIDKIDELLTIYKEADGDEYKIRKCSENAEALFNDIKKERAKGLESSDSEISNGNVIFKCLRRMGYIEKIYDLKSKTYDKMNSLT